MFRRDLLATLGVMAAGAALEAAAAPRREARPGPYVAAPDGTSLFVKDWGAGRPVVFVHSAYMSSDVWEYQMAHLAGRGFRCVAYDRRGHGRSGQPGGGFDYDTLAGDLASVIEALDLRGVTLVGHSMAGGEIVRYLSRRGAARVARIALVATTLPFPMKTDDNPEGVDMGVVEASRRAIAKDRPKWFADGVAGFFGAGTAESPVSPEMVRWALDMCMQSSIQAALECQRAIVETDFRAELRGLKVPALVIHGDADQSTPLELTGRRTARAIPGARLLVYEGAPHGLVLTHRDRLGRDLAAFAGGS
jgi:pimeloyl-ACP methyl ester carboxylesterase